MTSPGYSPYAVARFDGFLVFSDIQVGMVKTGITRSPAVKFGVVAGHQRHPVYALDHLALIVYSYCLAAREMKLDKAQLQVSITASWISTEQYSNLIAVNIEWHTAMSMRPVSQRMLAGLDGRWPVNEITFPGQRQNSRV